MSAKTANDFRLGFLTTISLKDRGHVGGMLITNRQGRPLEFQCTTPVQANRTQEILYGPTLLPYLRGELIGRTLVEKMRLKPTVVLVDDLELLSVRDHISMAAACLISSKTPQDENDLVIADQNLRLADGHEDDRATLQKLEGTLAAESELAEPFQRIQDALNEALGKAAAPTREAA
ncbi:hypothetical protein [Thalassoroseus pseudoceratinae]|uniref:hypothetical protein n=1 Tax=Thalassoroseus pseudoceratinae TaxID=2713176 RepID=UPI00141FDF8D|nr:hypothetical protein [Thalassoroseus pseudoceratinae]